MFVNPFTFAAADVGVIAAGFVTMSGTTATLNKQKNVASVTRTGLGLYTVNFNGGFADANYGVLGFARKASGAADMMALASPVQGGTYSTSAVQLIVTDGAGTAIDPLYWGFVVFDPAALSNANYQAAAMWTQTGVTVTLQKQKNMATVSYQADGEHKCTYTSALADADYSSFRGGRFATQPSIPRMSPDRYTGGSFHYTAALQDIRCCDNNGSTFNLDKGAVLAKHASGTVPGQLAAVRVTLSGGVATIVSQDNVASVVQQTTGVYRVTFTTALADAQYLVFCGGKAPASGVSSSDQIAGPNCNTTSSRGNFSTTSVDIAMGDQAGSLREGEWLDVWVVDPSLL